MNVRYRVEPSQAERDQLTAMLRGGHHAARKLKRAQILLAADGGATDAAIAASVGVGESTVYRTKRRFVEGNLELALSEEPRAAPPRKLSGKEEALLVATACSSPPQGRARWTLELLAGEMVRLTNHSGLSRETVRRRLAENELKPWRQDMWCIPEVDGTCVARMEDVLDLYAEPPDPKRPVVCFDESPTQLIGEVRQPIPAAPGQPRRYDYEYRRNGTVNLFVFLDAHRPWRKVKVTEQRTAREFAECMRDLVDVHYPQAELVRVVWTICPRTLPELSMKPFRRQKPIVSFVAWNSITRPSTRAGSTWSRLRSASCVGNVSIGGSANASSWSRRLPLGRNSATKPELASSGCSL